MPSYPSIVNIGGAYGTTWGTLRSPVVNGTGYRGNFPESENWGKDLIIFHPYFFGAQKFSSGYPKPVSDLCKIQSIYVEEDYQYGIYSTGGLLGCNAYVSGQDPEGGIIVEVYLGCGSGYYQQQTFVAGSYEHPRDEGYTKGTGNPTTMDTPSLRENFVGAVVNVTIRLGWGYGETTHDVVITNDLFPDDPEVQTRGQRFLEVVLPQPEEFPPPPSIPSFFWTINSVTLPS